MRTSLWLSAMAAFAMSALPAAAAPDAGAAMALAKDNGCTKCHAVDKSKKGPSYQKIAAKYKGKADAPATLTDALTKTSKVKLDDGSEEEHKPVNTKDSAKLGNLVQWILAQ